MALINCPECGQSVSDTARKCPGCGYALKKFNYKKWLLIISSLVLLLVAVTGAYYFFIYAPQQIPLKAMALLEEGKYVEADALFARLEDSEENHQLRKQLFYESRILNAAKAIQKELLFPDTMVISEVVIWESESLDESASTETQKVYASREPRILIHYLAKSKGGSMVDGYATVYWEKDIDSYELSSMYDDLEVKDSLPWYIDPKDSGAAYSFWIEQSNKARLKRDLLTLPQVGSFDLNRCNNILKNTDGATITIIPAGDIVVTPSPRVVMVTPKPET